MPTEEAKLVNFNTLTNNVSNLNDTVGEILYSGSYTYAGGAENWYTFEISQAMNIAVRLPSNAEGNQIEVAALTNVWNILIVISDDKWHFVEIPSGVSNKLVLTYRGENPLNLSCIITDAKTRNIVSDVVNLESNVDYLMQRTELIHQTEQKYGNDGTYKTSFISSFLNFTACPCKKTEKAGKVTSLYVKSYNAGTTKLYVGEVDQLYLFVPRKSFDITVAEGEQTIDVSSLDIYIEAGEQVLFKFIGRTPFVAITGEPEGDTSFYYSYGTLQLQVYGAQKAAVFGFGYTIVSSDDYEQDTQIEENKNNIKTLQEDVSVLQANLNAVSDRSGNKYKMIVQNGAVTLLAMNFKHVLCVGNSYTIHPTTSDTETDYKNNLWWGHWSMAASSNTTVWTNLLQNVLKQKRSDAVVTPVFGRRYETSYNTYGLNNPSTFTYWDGTAWQSLINNIANFSDVDAIIFFLGANYSGNDWYTLYKAMVERFYTWFPNATIFCCSCSYNAMEAKDNDIKSVASEEYASYISMVGTGSRSKIGSYVLGDDGIFHQINNSAVANHYGDYGQYLILDRICNGIGYENNTVPLDISLSTISGVTLTLATPKTIEGAVVSVFADVASGATLTGLTVTDVNTNAVSVIDHGVTDYGRVFTFIMPNTSVTITAS